MNFNNGGAIFRLFQGGTDTRKIGSFQDHFQTLY